MVEVTSENFKSEVLESDIPVLVDLWAPWCGPCRAMLPVIDELIAELEHKPFKVVKLNVDENGDLAGEYGVMSIPTFIVFKGGEEKERLQGAQTREKLKEALGVDK